MPVACQSCAPECPQAFGAEGDLPRIIPRGMPGARSLRARLPWQSRGSSRRLPCGGDGPMSTRKGQAASVTLLRREQLRSASAPTGCGAKLSNGLTEASAPTDTSEVRRKIRPLLGEGLRFAKSGLTIV